jgi:hypothetical protein
VPTGQRVAGELVLLDGALDAGQRSFDAVEFASITFCHENGIAWLGVAATFIT